MGARKVAKTTEGTSASDPPHPKKKITIEVGTTPHFMGVKLDDIAKKDVDDQGTIKNLILRELCSKNMRDRPSVVHPYLPSKQQAFEEKLKQCDVTKATLRRSLASAETRASVATNNVSELASNNGQLEENLAKVKQRCAELEQIVVLADLAVADHEAKARTAKETLATSQQSML
ncbi:hypothetical protein LWI28_012399 [Acer negundo]|uniref:Uncharacterized protein n=1 Tax=Acer negundo TaxID=4023 RepID=A0AAD5JKE6_ACENE|nr:hypothetical protein LWI28_012399 [Acer negundo]